MTVPLSASEGSNSPRASLLKKLYCYPFAAVARFVSHLGFSRLINFLFAFDHIFSKRPLDSSCLLRVLRWKGALCTISGRCRSNQGCLERSVATFILCRSLGLDVVWVSGFRPVPFLSHAWVEVGGVPVGEAAFVRDFQVIASVGAGVN